MSREMVLIMIDECGDEVEVNRFNIGDELDEDYIEMWKDMKISKAREEYQEARGFYFEDRSEMRRAVNAAVHEFFGDCYDEDEEYEDEDEDEICCEDCPDSECTGHCFSCTYRSV